MRPIHILATIIAATPLVAMETPVTGARQLGMGASGIATTDDHTVPWWNPAALGWEAGAAEGSHPTWASSAPGSVGLEANAGFRVYGDIVTNADALLHAATTIKELGTTGIASQADLKSFLSVAGKLSALNDPADSLMARGNVAGSIRLGRFAVGIRGSAESAAWASDIDLRNVIPNVSGDQLATAINGSGQTFDSSLQRLDATQAQDIYASLGGVGTFDPNASNNASQATLRIDDALRELGSTGPLAADAATWLVATATGVGTLDNNTTSLVVQSFSYVEVPISVGMPINEHFALGGSLKLMSGRVYGTRILVFQEDVENAVADFKGGYRDSLNVGVDFGLQAKAGNWCMALTGTNLNSPTFAGPSNEDGTFRSVTLDPQMTIGLGWRPADWFTVAADVEMIEVSTINPAIASQRAGAGFEFAAIPWLDLRGGVYANLADAEIVPVITGGAGLGPEWCRVDAAVALASEMQDFGEWTLPTELRAGVGLSSRW